MHGSEPSPDVDLGRLVSFPQESVGTRSSFGERIAAPLSEFSARLAEHRALCLLWKTATSPITSPAVQGAIRNQLDTMEQITQDAFAGLPDLFSRSCLSDASTLLDPFVALDRRAGPGISGAKADGTNSDILDQRSVPPRAMRVTTGLRRKYVSNPDPKNLFWLDVSASHFDNKKSLHCKASFWDKAG